MSYKNPVASFYCSELSLPCSIGALPFEFEQHDIVG